MRRRLTPEAVLSCSSASHYHQQLHNIRAKSQSLRYSHGSFHRSYFMHVSRTLCPVELSPLTRTCATLAVLALGQPAHVPRASASALHAPTVRTRSILPPSVHHPPVTSRVYATDFLLRSVHVAETSTTTANVPSRTKLVSVNYEI